MGNDGDPPRWAVASWDWAEIWGRKAPAGGVIGFDFGREPDGRPTADLLTQFGDTAAWTETGEQPPRVPPAVPHPVGRDCAALHGGRWWVVDPVGGELFVPGEHPTARRLGAVGIAPAGDALLVATADQHLHVVDPATAEAVRTFPATVVPPRRLDFGECALLAAGHGWVASFDELRGLLYVYDEESGAPLGRIPLLTLLGTGPGSVHAIRGAGDYLGVAHDFSVSTVRVARDARCATAAP